MKLKELEERLPNHYYGKLSKNNKIKQLKELEKSRKAYKSKKYYDRKKMPSFKSKKSRHVVDFEKKYCVNITHLPKVEKATGVPIQALKEILKKGRGAYYSSGSRPNQSSHSWAYARLGSVLLKRNAYKIDKHILDKYKADITPPKKTKCKQHGGNRQKTKKTKKTSKNLISCCLINNENESKYKKCQRKRDGKIFNLPRKFTRKSCNMSAKGFTKKASCAIYKDC